MAIIFVTPEIELHADWMEWGLKEAGFEVIRWAGLGWRPEDAATIRCGDKDEIYLGNHKLSPNDTVWLRRPQLTVYPAVDAIDKKFASGEYEGFKRTLLLEIEHSGARCINKWSSVVTIDDKSVQLSLARRCGLRVPATVIGNSSRFIKEFLARPEADVVHKAFRPHVWIRADGGMSCVETTALLRDTDWPEEAFACAPGIYQQRVAKGYDVRINMIGRDFHTFAITTPGLALDWRSHSMRNEVQAQRTTLPADVEAGLRAFAEEAGLEFGCFDMVVDPAGDWWFLEVNQAGQFLWIDLIQPDDGIYEPMLKFLTANEPATGLTFPSFSRCLAECALKPDYRPQDEDFPFHTLESKAVLAAG